MESEVQPLGSVLVRAKRVSARGGAGVGVGSGGCRLSLPNVTPKDPAGLESLVRLVIVSHLAH